jgi:hypothetical protein
MTQKTEPKCGEPVVFHPKDRKAMIIVGLLLALPVGVLFMYMMISMLESRTFIGGLFAFVITGSAVIMPFQMYAYLCLTGLTISPEGIDFHYYGHKGFIYWEEMKRFDNKISRWGISHNSQIELQKNFSARFISNRDTKKLPYFLPLNGFSYIKRRFIIVGSINLDHFQSTPLGSEIYRHAPHLFDEEKARRKNGT